MDDGDDHTSTAGDECMFTGLTPEWAEQVARKVHGLGLRSTHSPRLAEVWLTQDLALHVRYHIGSDALAVRIGRLDVDPTSMGAPLDSARLASDLFHNLHDAPEARSWTDALGFGWWGDSPREGWAAVETRERVLTLT